MKNINADRLIERIGLLGGTGIDAEGRRTRLAASDEDKIGRDLVASWMADAGMRVVTDYIGNVLGIWETPKNRDVPHRLPRRPEELTSIAG